MSMRYIVLDIETTGLSPKSGDKIIEIRAAEIDKKGNIISKFHQLIHPQRKIPKEVVRIHEITNKKVKHCPSFPEVEDKFLTFIEGTSLIIHNASFDLEFILHELTSSGCKRIKDTDIIDTLVIARAAFPNQRNNIHALSDRFGIPCNHDECGAISDVTLLSKVWKHLSKLPHEPAPISDYYT